MPESNIRLINEKLRQDGKAIPVVKQSSAKKPSTPAVTQGSSSAYQKLRGRTSNETSDRWYSGDQPTNSEVLANIYTVSQYNQA